MPEILGAITTIKDPIMVAIIVYLITTVRQINKHIDRHCDVLDKLVDKIGEIHK